MTTETEKLRRLRWRCRRGLLELDIVLKRFLDQEYDKLNDGQRQLFDELLELPDNTLLAYLNKQEKPEDVRLRELLTALQ